MKSILLLLIAYYSAFLIALGLAQIILTIQGCHLVWSSSFRDCFNGIHLVLLSIIVIRYVVHKLFPFQK